MLLCVSSRESSEMLSAATGEVQVVADASFKFGDTGAVGVEGLGGGAGFQRRATRHQLGDSHTHALVLGSTPPQSPVSRLHTI